MKIITQNYATNNHNFIIRFEGKTATIILKHEKGQEEECFLNPVTFDEFNEIIETAAIKGVTKINYNCTYSTEVERTHWANTQKKYGIKLERISN